MAIADRCPAITSCRSRAILARSAAIAARWPSSLILASCMALRRSAPAISLCCRMFVAHHKGMTRKGNTASPVTRAVRRSGVNIIMTTTDAIVMAAVIGTMSWLSRRGPYRVAA
ncbi:hypothetical protein ACFQ0B_78120 [Nonomuraea thailandensis]